MQDPEPPSVLVVVLDSVRARNTSLYGYERETTPFLEELAESATVYEQARAPSIHSTASHVSMFTGYHVEEHRAIEHESIIDETETIWHELGQQGYPLGMFTNNIIVSTASNLSAPFDHISERFVDDSLNPQQKLFKGAYGMGDTDTNQSKLSHLSHAVRSGKPVRSLANLAFAQYALLRDSIRPDPRSEFFLQPGSKYTNQFLDWQESQSGPWAAFLNIMDAHGPFDPESDYDRWSEEDARSVYDLQPFVWNMERDDFWEQYGKLEGLYDGAILQADDIIRSLVRELKNRGIYDDTLLIVTSDHGEAFGESSVVEPDVRILDHSYGLHEVQTHVPLVVKYPGQTTGERISEVATLTSMPAVIREVVDDPTARPRFTDEPVIASTYRKRPQKLSSWSQDAEKLQSYAGPWRALYTNQDDVVRKNIRHEETEIAIDIPSAQKYREVSDAPQLVESTYAELADVGITDPDAKPTLSDALEDHLEALGYVR
jgi:arylsulfatase A-like enzyme